ncbi:hypothetical protein LJC74_00645 [Eubacteriales bacterium OttesenSCG-928-A19]|nr:hypothetical protein [Eubacteriales bacterium OttesenSCG-928-A19]
MNMERDDIKMEEKRFTLRMDAEIFSEISMLAKDHRRSVAKEIECAVAKYIYDEKHKAYLAAVDPEDAGAAKVHLKNLLLLEKKYGRFE